MRKPTFVRIYFVVASLAVVLSYSATVSAVDDPKAERKAFEKQVEQTMVEPVLRGDTWQRMTEDCQFAFIWGGYPGGGY